MERVNEHVRSTVLEQHLTAPPARGEPTAVGSCRCERSEPTAALQEHRAHERVLGAHRQPEGHVLDVDAGDDATVGEERGGADV